MSAPAQFPSFGGPSPMQHIVAGGLMHRGALAGLEFRDARAHAAVTAAIAGVAAALALLCGFAGTLAVTAAVWDRPDRCSVLCLVGLAYAIGAAALGWWTARRLRSWHPFAETTRQLRDDCTCLHRYMSGNSR